MLTVLIVVSSILFITTGYLWNARISYKKQLSKCNKSIKMLSETVLSKEGLGNTDNSEGYSCTDKDEEQEMVAEFIKEIECMVVTNVICDSYKEEYDNAFRGTKPLVTIELNGGAVKLIDLIPSIEHMNDGEWYIDVLCKGSALPRISEDNRKKLRKIFTKKMIEYSRFK